MLTASILRHFPRAPDQEQVERRVTEVIASLQQSLTAQAGPCVPRFHFPKPASHSIAEALDEAVHDARSRKRQLFGQSHINVLSRLLEQATRGQQPSARADALGSPRSSPGVSQGQLAHRRLSYDEFVSVAAEFTKECGLEAQQFLSASTFMRFQPDADSRIPVACLLEYAMTKGHRLYLWQRIAAHDSDHDGLLTAAEVEQLLMSFADEFQYKLPRELEAAWRVIAPRKVLFQLGKNGLVAVKDLLADPMLEDITGYDCLHPLQTGGQALDWFSPEKAQAIHDKFVELDEDGDGKLSAAELGRVRMAPDSDVSSMADFYLTRLFEEHVHGVSAASGEPAMDLAEFADFLLAWNFRGQLPSARYFFKVLDVENVGKLSGPVVAAWCKHVAHVAVERMGVLYAYEPLDVKDEVFDMVTPQDPDYITLKDLMQSGMADTICGILVDGQCHYEYDQRESLAQAHDEE